MTHTKGPWTVSIDADFLQIHGDGSKDVLCCLGLAPASDWPSDVASETNANARLISAAPEMLEHGQFLLDRIDELDFADMPKEFMRDWMGHVEPALSRFRAILAKARGTT